MNRRSAAYVLAACVMVAALGWIAWETHVRMAAREAIAADRAELERVRGDTRTIDARVTRLNGNVAGARRQLAAAQQPAVAPARQWERPPRPTEAEFAQQMAVRQHAMVALELLPVIKALGLSPEQGQKLVQLCVERLAQGSDIYIAARDQKLGTESAGLRAMLDQTQENWRNQVVALVGETGWRVMEEYQRPVNALGLQAIAADLCFTSEPLSVGQAEALRHAISEIDGAHVPVMTLQPFRYGDAAVPSTIPLEMLDSELAAAKAFRDAVTPLLTPAQREVVENRLIAAELNLRLSSNSYAIWRAVRKAGGVSAAPAP